MEARVKFGKFIAEMRELQGRTQAEVATEVGWGAQFMSNIERGVARCPIEKVALLARAIGYRPKELFNLWEKVNVLENRERWKTLRRVV